MSRFTKLCAISTLVLTLAATTVSVPSIAQQTVPPPIPPADRTPAVTTPLQTSAPAAAQAPTNPTQPPDANSDVEVLARGPVHEAFAEPVNLQGVDPLTVTKAPPAAVEELPPDQKPEGENVDWIPGYWAWDEDRTDYIWISGVWRDVPPQQRWVPGYWSENKNGRGWSWTPGFWAAEQAAELQYLPEPPQTLEEGPQVQAPSANHIWIPGVWRYHQTRYVWRPGYWTVAQPEWVWVPARYAWCPSGYIFVDGYWDYPLERRGVLFAPVYYRQPLYVRPNYYYTPSVCVSTDILTVHLFARPRYCHYYFGDYYAPRYRQIGIEPWLMVPRIRGCYDPLFTYYRWRHHRHGRDWYRECHDRYHFFARHEHYRPAHTYADLRRQRFDRVHDGDAKFRNIVANQKNLAEDFKDHRNRVRGNVGGDVFADRDGGRRTRFSHVAENERRDFVEQARNMRNFTQRRTRLENTPPGDVTAQTDSIGDVSNTAENRGDRRSQGRRSLNLADLDRNNLRGDANNKLTEGKRDQFTPDANRDSVTRRGDRSRSRISLPPRPEQATNGNLAGQPTNTGSTETTNSNGAQQESANRFTRGRDGNDRSTFNRDNRTLGGRTITGSDQATTGAAGSGITTSPQINNPLGDNVASDRQRSGNFTRNRQNVENNWAKKNDTRSHMSEQLRRYNDSVRSRQGGGQQNVNSDPRIPSSSPRLFNRSSEATGLQQGSDALNFQRSQNAINTRRESSLERSNNALRSDPSGAQTTQSQIPSRSFSGNNDAARRAAFESLRRQSTSAGQQLRSPRPSPPASSQAPQSFNRSSRMEPFQSPGDVGSQIRAGDFSGRSFQRQDYGSRSGSQPRISREPTRSFTPPSDMSQRSSSFSDRSSRFSGGDRGGGNNNNNDNDNSRRRGRDDG